MTSDARIALVARWLQEGAAETWDPYDLWALRPSLAIRRGYYRRRWPAIGAAAAISALDVAAGPVIRALFCRKKLYASVLAQRILASLLLVEAGAGTSLLEGAAADWAVLEETAAVSTGEHLAWGLPFDWMSSLRFYPAGTPFITQTTYALEASASFYALTGQRKFKEAGSRIALFLRDGVHTEPGPSGGVRNSYGPNDKSFVYNSAAYRAFCLALASHAGFIAATDEAYASLEYVLLGQNADGSWFYGEGDAYRYVDNYHTVFVLKNILKYALLVPDLRERLRPVIKQGTTYYVRHLIDRSTGLPRPYAVAPRHPVFDLDAYDLAESAGYATLLHWLPGDPGEWIGKENAEFFSRIREHLFLEQAIRRGRFLWRRFRGGIGLYRNYQRWAVAPHMLAVAQSLLSSPPRYLLSEATT